MTQEIKVQKETNGQQIYNILKTDRIWASYAICDLEEELFPLCDWYVAYRNGEAISFCMHYNGIQPPAQISIGDPIGLAKIFETVNLPIKIHAHIPIKHRIIISKYYHFSELHMMKRMFISLDYFKEISGEAEKLCEEDLADLVELYLTYSGNFFRPYMLTSGAYYGFKTDNKLVSAAGTHVCSPSYNLACVGNVFTHPSYRRKGYATICTSHLLKELLTRFQTAILNVDSQNMIALRIYRKLGFREYCTFIEGMGRLHRNTAKA